MQSPNTSAINALVSPEGSLEVLSQHEVNRLRKTSSDGHHEILRHCALAVLSCGSPIDDTAAMLRQYPDFDIEIIQRDRGILLKLTQAPADAFVDGVMIRGMREHIFAVLRDLVYVSNEIKRSLNHDLTTSDGITDAVFHILRNARVLRTNLPPNLIVCWGGHSISREEYDYSKAIGYHLGLRELDICTGCGPGAMKGPMKGANVAHAKQRTQLRRYIGITEPGIIAAEAPNPIVNELVIMPDIEKRLEAFVRLGHGIIVFPGGVGTAEEILYLLGILSNPENQDQPFPVIFTGPESSRAYFEQIDHFIVTALGEQIRDYYSIIINNPIEVAHSMKQSMQNVRLHRIEHKDAFYFNWQLKIDKVFQQPFNPTHQAMSELQLHRDQPIHLLAANLRRAFSGIVAGNVKEAGIRAIQEQGPFQLQGDPELLGLLDKLLSAFAQQGRMKLAGKTYNPCYQLIS
ncbi:nucleotide 5'-monophosphate nucleosidase PpnN [Marinospirillum insulare]|uniref:AMP nucleosidase n=1 Tax=Marinospirillum insulare TaxID=217169 RepID=A0ABQ5ZW00_9GAMM|nr:nucleotide 5'-monophosphate nucleosidase PpnN [Marinospirillum insulare]GLR64189.1 LOG family protein [Marinospirillum insulare]